MEEFGFDIAQRGRSLQKILGVAPQRGSLTNLETQQSIPFLLNPVQLEENYEAVYSRRTSPGLSHERMQYSHTKNVVIPLELVYDEYIFRERNRGRNSITGGGVAPGNRVEIVRRNLQALVYPRRSQRLISASPPQVLFAWPGFISMRVRITKLKFRHVFFQNGVPIPRVTRVNLTLEEDVEQRIYSDQLSTFGTMRPWATSDRPRRRGT